MKAVAKGDGLDGGKKKKQTIVVIGVRMSPIPYI